MTMTMTLPTITSSYSAAFEGYIRTCDNISKLRWRTLVTERRWVGRPLVEQIREQLRDPVMSVLG
jgi:hypothetical protein